LEAPGQYIIGYDIGTTSTKCIIADQKLRVLSRASESYGLTHPNPMWAEQDPEVLWHALVSSTRTAIEQSKILPPEIISVSISCQTPCLIPVEKDGRPLRPCISWLDARAVSEAENMRERLGLDTIYEKTGVLVSAKDIICKLLWLRENEGDVFERTYKLLDLKDYLIYKLTGNFATDWTCASLTALFDIKQRKWSDELCEFARVPVGMLSEAHPSNDIVGEITPQASRITGLRSETPVVVGAGDVFCAALGSGAIEHGSSHLYLGTSSWIGTSVSQPSLDPNRRVLCSCHADPDKWLILGLMESTGICLKWFLDQLGASEISTGEEQGTSPYKILDDEAARVEPGSMGLVFFPYMLGEKSPIYDPYAKGGFIGLTLKHTRAHMVRSILEGIAFQIRWIIESIEELGFGIDDLRLIGGGAQSKLWPKIITDVSHKKLTIMRNPIESGAIGAVLNGLVAMKMQEDFGAAAELLSKGSKVQPSGQSAEKYDKLYSIFTDHYAKVKDLYQRLTNI